MKHISKQLFAIAGLSALSMGAYAQDRPNIIFILTDDQSFDMLGCTGNPIVQTPNIDKLAGEGVLFTNAHVSSAISTPSRTCILTGRYERSHGVNFNSGTSLSDEAWAECYPMILRENGYYTGYIGKNHTPIGIGGYSSGVMDSSYDYWYAGHEHLSFYPKERHKIFKGAKANTQVEVINEGMMDFLNPNERNLAGAVHFLGARPKDEPFFMNICFNLPHDNGTASMKQRPTDDELYRTGYRDIEIPLPVNYIAKKDIKTPKLPAEILHASDRQTGYNYVDTPEAFRERYTRKLEAVTGIDRLVGELVKELKAQKLDKNTIIIFTSDHGQFIGEYGLGGKSLCYEICTHVPMFIYNPMAKKGTNKKVNNELVLTIDISRTILDYAGIEAPESYQGETLTPMLAGEEDSVREYLFTENLWSTHFGNPRCESVQNKEWKYIRYYKNENPSAVEKMKAFKEMGLNPNVIYKTNLSDVSQYRMFVNAPLNGEKPVYEELYNIKEDPKEAINLIGANQYADLVEELRKECDKQVRNARGTGSPRVYVDVPDYEVKPE